MTEHECVVCGDHFTGRKDAKCCSEACRQALFRAKTAPEAVTTGGGPDPQGCDLTMRARYWCWVRGSYALEVST
jgi:hypothetical protein